MRISKAIRISRPFGYIIGPIVFLVPIFLYGVHLSPIIVIQALLLTFPLSFFLFGLNDIYDMKTDRDNPRKGGIEGAVLASSDISSVQSIAAVCAALMFIPAILRPDITNLAATTLLLLFGIAYSVPPLRLKERPPLDSLSNALIIGLIMIIGLSYGPGLAGFPIQGFYLLFGMMGIHIFSTLVDYGPDSRTGVMTFATLFGRHETALASAMIFIFILAFSGIADFIIKGYLAALSLISLIVIFRPDEKTARIGFWFMFLLFLIAGIAYIIRFLL